MICALLVVGIHTEPFENSFLFDNFFGVLTRIAVPIFFMISSFLFFSRSKSLSKYIYRIFTIYIVWCIFYGVVDLIMNNVFSIDTFKNLILNVLCGYKHLWYLNASIVAIIIVSFFEKKFSSSLIVSAVLFCIGIFLTTYKGIFGYNEIINNITTSVYFQKIGEARNGVFYAPIYFSLGAFFAKHQPNIRLKTNIILIVMSFLCLAIEGAFSVLIIKTTSTILYFSTILLVSYIFVLALNIRLRKHWIYLYLRKISVLVYLIHPLFIGMLKEYLNGLLLFLIVSVLSILFSILFIHISSREKFKFLRRIY